MPDVGNFGTLVSLIVLGVTYMIIQPLKQSIATLTDSINDLREEVKVSRKDLSDIKERLAKVEASTSSAHKRLDQMERR